ncbi:phosphotransferase enzyme family protein [Alkalihalobacillus pseudalcaliphilus]|uniref:phosphotransferase enzyme family protein n=1 Tax=Alkalihalobacillus pseudalcaliphilus TaxID=79884 RepID=UPI00064DC0D7|nr:phosphotransferase [Alkalihalobacillus pseudalcaliphilus]KMK75776.1 hypothetical protein AB990_10940 [Alkalihalobacillus pseudalcaliphilus]
MEVKKAITLIQYWDLELKTARPLSERAILITATNKQHYVLKKKNDILIAENEEKLLQRINQIGFKVQEVLLTVENRSYQEFENDTYCLYRYIEGDTFTADECLHNAIVPTVIGETIANLHQAMATSELDEAFPQSDLVVTLNQFVYPTLNERGFMQEFEPIRSVIDTSVEATLNQLPKQLIHRDMHIFNLIYQGGQLAEVIDFDLVQVNVRIFDLAYCSTSILNEVFENQEKRERWFEFVSLLCDSYSDHNRLSKEEKSMFFYVLIAIQLIFIGFFHQEQALYQKNKEMLDWILQQKERIEAGMQ